MCVVLANYLPPRQPISSGLLKMGIISMRVVEVIFLPSQQHHRLAIIDRLIKVYFVPVSTTVVKVIIEL